MKLKGVCYDVGRVIGGENQHPEFDEQSVRRELGIIRSDLHCNTVRICGQDIERVMTAGRIALDLGLDVWLSPELWGHALPEALGHLSDAARAAEDLRRTATGNVVLSVASEATLFMPGILSSGGTIPDLIRHPLRLAAAMLRLRTGGHNKRLNAFLVEAATVARGGFRGPITYASVPIERVDWSSFDIVSVDYYRGKQNRATYAEGIDRYLALGKPVVVTELGCCTYRGAEDKGGRGFLIVDRRHPDRITPGYVRDEGLQARELTDMLSILDHAGVDGAFVLGFASPTLIHRDDPLHDFDMASYSLVKTLPTDVRSRSYPDMRWEPKQAFHAVSAQYRDA